jgi:fumarylacetoacetase
MTSPDPTLDPDRQSWVSSANGHPEFPIQNLPFGVFSPHGEEPRGGIAIGESILDLRACLRAGLLSGEAEVAGQAASGGTLNEFLALGAPARAALRADVGHILDLRSESAGEAVLHPADSCTLHLPVNVGDYTDFFAGIHHATNTGRLFRPDNPLLANYKHVPVAYHGRASSVCASGAAVMRPHGQRKPAAQDAPDFGPSRNLDFELELGVWIGPGNALRHPINVTDASHHVAGFCLLNDWSARDVQGWEYQPLGPFLAKNFCTSVSPWIVTPEALAPFRLPQPPRPDGDPAPLPYLLDDADQRSGALDIMLEVMIATAQMRETDMYPFRLSQSNARHLYWTVAQMVAHHTCGGCNLRPGDLFGSGTISAPDRDGFGSMLELSEGGRQPITLPSGETRRFLEDGDEIIVRGYCERPGYARIGFGECRGRIAPAA